MLRIAVLALLSALATASLAPAAIAGDGLTAPYATPPRLSLVNGPVSFWRPGNRAWENAALNTPLAEGDALATSDRANAEIQVGAQAWVRAANATEISITANRPEVTAITLTAGVASIDVRAIAAGQTLDIITPHATIAIGIPGYYRITTNADATRLAVRRGGNAQLRSPSGRMWRVQAGEEALLDRADRGALQLLALPAEDQWDRWNIGRGDSLVNSIGARHVPAEVYGLAELDRYGSWRHDGPYGPVWIPAALPAGWTPYSAGRWIDDPVHGRTWIDDTPWGYAPFRYGRWIDLGGTWAWAPGPRLARPAYAPAPAGWNFNSQHAVVRPRHDEHRFEARPDFGRPADGRPRAAAPLANLPAPAPRALPPAMPVAAQPTPQAVNRESQVRAVDGHREQEPHGRHAAAGVAAQPFQPQPHSPAPRAAMPAPPPTPAQASAPPAIRTERPAPAQPAPFTSHRGAGDNHHGRRVEAAAPAPRPAANTAPVQVRRSDETSPAVQGGARREGSRPEGAERRPRP